MPCGNMLCERYGQHREEWHEEEKTLNLKHWEKIICQPCPECKGKLKAAEEMGKVVENALTKIPPNFAAYKFLQAALSLWEQAGKEDLPHGSSRKPYSPIS